MSSITQSHDADRLNAIINHPTVRPHVGSSLEGDLDFSGAIDDPNNIFLLGEHGGMIFQRHQFGLFEAHTFALPEGRGAWTLGMVRDALHWMFCRTEAMEIMTRCPKGNFAAKALARAIHGTFEFTNQNGFIKDGQIIPADIYRLSIQDWMMKAEKLVERGHWFHEKLEAEFDRMGLSEKAHPDDLTHDRYVGAACEMVLGGQVDKAVILYNRWAAMADYERVSIVSREPAVINIQSAIIKVLDSGDIHVSVPREALPN